MSDGKLIALEGIDGSGTTTQARALVAWMKSRGLPTHLTCEPSSGPLGQLLRKLLRRELPAIDPAAMALLFAGDRIDHVHTEILPSLRRGLHVVTDRYVYSSLAYQSLELELAWVAQINRIAPEPDLTCYLRIDPGIAQERRAVRGGDEEIFDAIPLQQRIATRYDEIFGSFPPADLLSGDPAGSWRIPQDLGGSRRIPQAISRAPRWEALDAALDIDTLQSRLRNLVEKICPKNV